MKLYNPLEFGEIMSALKTRPLFEQFEQAMGVKATAAGFAHAKTEGGAYVGSYFRFGVNPEVGKASLDSLKAKFSELAADHPLKTAIPDGDAQIEFVEPMFISRFVDPMSGIRPAHFEEEGTSP